MRNLGRIKFTAYGESVAVDVIEDGVYGDGTKVIELAEKEGDWCTLTVCIPGTALADDERLIKTWSENRSARQPLLDTGIFTDTGRRVPTGYVTAEVWKVNAGA